MKMIKLMITIFAIVVTLTTVNNLYKNLNGMINNSFKELQIFDKNVQITTNPIKNLNLVERALDQAINFEY